MEKVAKSKILALLLVVTLITSGCGHVITAIEHSDMQTKVKMSNTIFLDPVVKAKNRTVYVSVSNTSDMQEVDTGLLQNLLLSKLAAKGYRSVDDPTQAGYIIQVNVLYMDYVRQTGTREGALTGALAAGGLGAIIGQSKDTSIALGLIGGLVGGVGGALIGKAIKVETYAGSIDVQIQEKTERPVVGHVVTNVAQGTSTNIQTRQEVSTNRQIYRTQIAATAQQTNIDRHEAAKVIMDKLSTQIAQIF